MQANSFFAIACPRRVMIIGKRYRTIAALVEMAEKATGQSGTVGMGIPGSISPYTGVVKNANSTWLNGQPPSTTKT